MAMDGLILKMLEVSTTPKSTQKFSQVKKLKITSFKNSLRLLKPPTP
tara:strand:- start:655 stop:795 length:141 start_codon:yes stop_codon:yes gene_type:complete